MNERADLARKLELIGRFLMVDGLPELVGQYVEGMTIQKLNGITLQILAKGMAADKS